MLLHFRKSLYFYDHLYNYAICNITFGGGRYRLDDNREKHTT
nr:MAG TPA: hypothetical protein [Caudoviricetes sp.]